MDEKPSLLQRVHTTIVYLGAGLLLVEGSRTLLSRLNLRRRSPRRLSIKPEPNATSASVAFLVDGENISPTLVERALDEAKKLGEINVKRVYGSCTLFNSRWNDTSLSLGLEQIHLARPTINKNTADIALAVNAIELAKDGICNRFCIVSSDSDFTPLVRRLRDLKCQVLGVGERKTPNTLTKACNWFVFTDQFVPGATTQAPTRTPATPHIASTTRATTSSRIGRTPASAQSATEPSNGHQPDLPVQQPDVTPDSQPAAKPMPSSVVTILTEAYRDAVHGKEGEWVLLSRLGLSLRQLYPEFKATDYAVDLSDLIRKYYGVFDFGKKANGHPQMRLKQ